jgi:xylulokinase
VSGEVLLGVDIGTSSSKGILATTNGEVVATIERPHDLSLPQPGWAEHDAERIWWADFGAICAELVPRAGTDLAGVCVSGIGPCLLPTDARGEPLRPAILYGIDTRASREIEELTQQFGAERILERCGSPLTSQAIGPKLAWLRRNEPDVWNRTRRFMMASSFIVHRLTGNYVLDHHSASQCDPMYDISRNEWIEDWSSQVAPGLDLPELLWPSEVAGRVSAQGSSLTGIRAGTPVATGTIDAWAEAASVGVREPGDVMLMYGSTMFIVEVLDRPRSHPKLWGTTGIFPNTSNLAAGMATSGSVTAWLRKLAGDPPFEVLLREAGEVPAGSNGLIVLPYFAGERTPLFDSLARGLVIGLTLAHDRGHVYRAILEGTAFGVRHNLEVMAAAGGGGNRLVAVGGGTKGELWIQIVSDVLGRSQEIPKVTIGACYGDALLAGMAAGLIGRDSVWGSIAKVIHPRDEPHAAYERLYRIYRELYPATRSQMHDLAVTVNTALGAVPPS